MGETDLTRKQRWNRASEQQVFYNKTFNQNVSKSAFYKDMNPLTEKVIRYDISFGFNHKGNSSKLGGSYEFYLPQETISVYVIDDTETESMVKERVASQVADKFKGGAKNWVYNEITSGDNISVVRGIEKTSVEYKEIDTKHIVTSNGDFNQNLTKQIKIISKRNGSEKPWDCNLNIWL